MCLLMQSVNLEKLFSLTGPGDTAQEKDEGLTGDEEMFTWYEVRDVAPA